MKKLVLKTFGLIVYTIAITLFIFAIINALKLI